MPSSSEILDGLTAVATEWRFVAIGWHGALALFCASVIMRRRPSKRLAGFLLLSPLLSVSALAWASGNPFNGTTFAVLSMSLAAVAWRLPAERVRIEKWSSVALGAVLVVFGWVYPHFVEAQSWTSLAVA